MAEFGDSYSRMVAWLKIILPLTALAILSTLFLMSQSVDPTLSIPIAGSEIRDLANQPRIGKPAFSGVTENGSAFNLTAKVALPLPDDQAGIRVEVISATFVSPDGQVVDILANSGTVNSTTKQADLSGGVMLTTSFGYTIDTDTIIADLTTSGITTTGPINASGPLGSISAGQMILQPQTQGDPDVFELIFLNGVKLVYDPKKNRE